MHLEYKWQITLIIALGLLMAILDVTIVSVVLPQIATALHSDYQTSTWIGTGYLLASAAVIPIIGYLSDRIGSKTIYLLALGLFTLCSVLCAFAPNVQALIVFRVFQGIGGGALLPVAMAIVLRLFEPTERAGAIAVLMVPVLMGPAFGPTLGGYLATVGSWNAIFLINAPIGVIAFLLVFFVLRGKVDEQTANGNKLTQAQRFDWLGLVLAMTSFTVLVYGINQIGNGWNATVIGELVAGTVLIVAFILVELRVKDPVMELRLFRNYTFAISNIMTWVSSAVFLASLFLVPVFFERVENLSALSTGEIVITQGLAMAIGLAFGGRLYNRVGPRVLTMIGAILVSVSLFGFTRLTITTTGTDVQVWLILRGLGLGLFMQALQTLSASVVSRQQMAKATSLMSSTRNITGAIGVVVLITYLTQRTAAHATDALASCSQVAQRAVAQACVAQNALTMGMNDTFFLALIACAVCVVAAIFVGRDPSLEAAKATKKRGETIEESVPMTTP